MRTAGATSLIIGAGVMGRQHARCAAAAGARIVGIVDPDPAAARSLAEQWSGAAWWTVLGDGLKATAPGVAHICTPPSTHVDLANAAAAAGFHALVEKPLAECADQAHLIHDSFSAAGKMVCPVHQYAFQRSVKAAAVRFTRLGSLSSVAFDICSAGAVAGHITSDELIAEILPHPLSILQKLLPSINIARLDWTCVRGAPGEWAVTAAWNGIVLTMSLSAAGRPTRFLTRVTGQAGSLQIDHFHDFAVALPGTVSRAQKILAPFSRTSREFTTATWNLVSRAGRREFAYPGLQALMDEFYGAVGAMRDAPPITQEESIAVAEARDAIMKLANHG